MILLLGQTINLIPDKTIIPQFLIFLVVIVVLSVFVFRPTLMILEKRRKETAGLQRETERLTAEADAMERQYNERIASARSEGSSAERELLNLGEDKARKIVTEARKKSRGRIEKVEEEIFSEFAKSRQELSKKVGDFSKMIVSKVLGKND